jgi:hypothetical protein
MCYVGHGGMSRTHVRSQFGEKSENWIPLSPQNKTGYLLFGSVLSEITYADLSAFRRGCIKALKTPSFLSDNPLHANGLALFFPMTRQSRSARIFLYEKSAVWHRREKDTVLRSGTVATCTRSSAQYLPALFQDDAEKCRCGHPNSTAGSVYSPNCQRLTFPFQSAVTMKRPSSVS